MLDIAATREVFRDNVILDVGFVRTSQNIADGLRKTNVLRIPPTSFF